VVFLSRSLLSAAAPLFRLPRGLPAMLWPFTLGIGIWTRTWYVLRGVWDGMFSFCSTAIGAHESFVPTNQARAANELTQALPAHSGAGSIVLRTGVNTNQVSAHSAVLRAACFVCVV
jgi:hypothetical protein